MQIALVSNVQNGLGTLVAHRLLSEGYIVVGVPAVTVTAGNRKGLLLEVLEDKNFYEVHQNDMLQTIVDLGYDRKATHTLTVVIPNANESWSNQTTVFDTYSISTILNEVTVKSSPFIKHSLNLGYARDGKIVFVRPSSLANHPYSNIYEEVAQAHIKHIAISQSERGANHKVQVAEVHLTPLTTEDNSNMYNVCRIPSEEVNRFSDFHDALMEAIEATDNLHVAETPALPLEQFNDSGLKMAHKYK